MANSHIGSNPPSGPSSTKNVLCRVEDPDLHYNSLLDPDPREKNLRKMHGNVDDGNFVEKCQTKIPFKIEAESQLSVLIRGKSQQTLHKGCLCLKSQHRFVMMAVMWIRICGSGFV